MPIKAAIEEFAQRIQKMIEGHAMERAKAAVLDAFGLHAPKKRGRPPKALAALPSLPRATKGTNGTNGTNGTSETKKARKKLPPQFCPVPGCKNKAAPVFGMVCAQHKDVAKSKIKKYREERKAKKAGKTVARMSVVKAGSKKAPVKKVRAKAVAKTVARTAGRKAPKRRGKTAPVGKPASVASPPAAPVAAAP
jgi:hypothetical protein